MFLVVLECWPYFSVAGDQQGCDFNPIEIYGFIVKTCKKCLEQKELSKFNKAGKYYQSVCKICQYAYKKEWISKNPKKARLSGARARISISDKDFERICDIKECQICGIKHKSLHIDHDHKTGVIRGVLCPNCNHGLGKFMDDENILYRAIRYLSESKN